MQSIANRVYVYGLRVPINAHFRDSEREPANDRSIQANQNLIAAKWAGGPGRIVAGQLRIEFAN